MGYLNVMLVEDGAAWFLSSTPDGIFLYFVPV